MISGFELFLPPQIPFQLGLTQQPAISQRPRFVSGDMIIEADELEWSAEKLVHTMRGNVVGSYKETKLHCAEAILDEKNGIAKFSTGVLIEDPIGTLSAKEVRIYFEVDPKSGERKVRSGVAIGIDGNAYEARFNADELTMTPGKWVLKNATATNSQLKNPDYQLQFKELTLVPGDKVNAKSASLLLGKNFRIPLPFFMVSLRPQSGGIPTPYPVLDENFSLGYRINYGTPIGNRTTFLYEQRAKLSGVPKVNTQLVYSLLPRSDSDLRDPIRIQNLDGERFLESHLDNVQIENQEKELSLLSQNRALVFAGRSTRNSTRARLDGSEKLDREWYVGTEFGGKIGPIVGDVSLRFGEVEDIATSNVIHRYDLYAVFGLFQVPISDTLNFRIRTDAAMFFGSESHYGWIRPQFGIDFQPNDIFLSSIGYFQAETYGTPDFIADQLYSSKAMHMRFDFRWKPTDLSLLFKYDFDRESLYDYEIAIGQVIRSVKAFVTYRKFPGTLTFGVELRADKLLEALSKRSQSR